MTFIEELEEAIRKLTELFNVSSLEEQLSELADLTTAPESPQEKCNLIEGLRSVKPVCRPRIHHERWHTAATSE